MTKALKELVNIGVSVAVTGSVRSPHDGTLPHLDSESTL